MEPTATPICFQDVHLGRVTTLYFSNNLTSLGRSVRYNTALDLVNPPSFPSEPNSFITFFHGSEEVEGREKVRQGMQYKPLSVSISLENRCNSLEVTAADFVYKPGRSTRTSHCRCSTLQLVSSPGKVSLILRNTRLYILTYREQWINSICQLAALRCQNMKQITMHARWNIQSWYRYVLVVRHGKN